MAPQRAGFALVAAVLLVASVHASLYRVNPSVDTRTVGMYAASQDTVYLNVSFVAMTDSGEAAVDFTEPELGTLSAELMYAFFPWFAAPTPCPATGHPALDFTHLHFQISSIDYRKADDHSHVVTLGVAVTANADSWFDVRMFNFMVSECQMEQLDNPVSDTRVLSGEMDYTLHGTVLANRPVQLPRARGVFRFVAEFVDDAAAMHFAESWSDDANQGIRGAFTACLNHESGFYDSDWQGHFVHLNDTEVQYAVSMDNEVMLRIVVDVPRRTYALEDYDAPIDVILNADTVGGCIFTVAMWQHPSGAPGAPTHPGLQAFSATGSIHDYEATKFTEVDGGNILAVFECDNVCAMELGLDHGGSPKLHGAFSAMMRHGQRGETPDQSVATSDQVTIVAVSRNASHAFVVAGATIRPDQEEYWVDEDDLVAAFQEGLSMALMKDVHIPPFMGGGGNDEDTVGTSAGLIVTLDLSSVTSLVDGDIAQSVFAALFSAFSSLADAIPADETNSCGTPCMDGMALNRGGAVDATKHHFATMMQHSRAVGTTFSFFAYGDDAEVMAFRNRVEQYDTLTNVVNSVLCPADECTYSVDVSRVDFIGEGVRGPPGSNGRPGALGVFRLFGFSRESTDAPEFGAQIEQMLNMGDGSIASYLGCVPDPDSPMGALQICAVEVYRDGATDTERADMASSLTSFLPMAVDYATMYNAKTLLAMPESSTDVTVHFITPARAELLAPESQFTDQVRVAAMNQGVTDYMMWMWAGCMSSDAGATLCSITAPRVAGASNDDMTDLVQAVLNEAAGALASMVPLSAADMLMFDVISDCGPCRAAPRRGHVVEEGDTASRGEMEFAFRDAKFRPEMDGLFSSERNLGLAFRVATVMALNDGDSSNFLSDVEPADVFVDKGWESDSGDEDDRVFRFSIRAEMRIEGDDATRKDIEDEMKAARRPANIELAKRFSAITGLMLNPLCEVHLFEYKTWDNMGNEHAHVATDDCQSMFGVQCSTFNTINSRPDGSGKMYHVIPDTVLDRHGSGLASCGCDSGSGCSSGYGSGPGSDRRLRAFRM